MNNVKVIFLSFVLNVLFLSFAFSEIIKKIEIKGNKRISDETILMFSKIDEGQNFNNLILNEILKNLYDSIFLVMFQLNLKIV